MSWSQTHLRSQAVAEIEPAPDRLPGEHPARTVARVGLALDLQDADRAVA